MSVHGDRCQIRYSALALAGLGPCASASVMSVENMWGGGATARRGLGAHVASVGPLCGRTLGSRPVLDTGTLVSTRACVHMHMHAHAHAHAHVHVHVHVNVTCILLG